MHKAPRDGPRRAKTRSVGVVESSNRYLTLKSRPPMFYPREGITSAVMAELLGLAGHHGEGRGGQASELHYHIGWVVGKMVSMF